MTGRDDRDGGGLGTLLLLVLLVWSVLGALVSLGDVGRSVSYQARHAPWDLLLGVLAMGAGVLGCWLLGLI